MGAYSPVARPARRRGGRAARRRSIGRCWPSSPDAARPFRGFLYAGLDPDRRRAGPARVQRPARRPRGPGDPAPARRSARSGPPRRRSRRPRAGRPRSARAGRPALPDRSPAPRSGSSSPRGATRTRPSGASPIEGLEEAASRGRPRLPRRDARPAGRRLRHERRSGPDGRRPRVRTSRPPADGAERAADAIAWDGLQRRRDIAADASPSTAGRGGAAGAAAR